MISRQPQPTDQHAGTNAAVDWKRAHPAFMLTALVRNVRGFIIPIAILLIGNLSGDRPQAVSFAFLGISALILLLSGIAGIVQWWTYRYALTPDRLLVHSGIIFRQERAIPYQRIQTVDLEEAPLDRILGVARMKIETAAGGTGESEVQLSAVRRDEAEVVRERLLRARHTARQETPAADAAGPATGPEEPVTIPEASGEVLRTLSTGDLLLAGATSATIGPAAAIIGVAIQFADDLVPESLWRRVPWDAISDARTNLGLIAVVALVVAVFAWLLAIAGTILTYHGFELRRDDEHLVVQYGLLDRRRTTIPIRRIQAVRVEEGLLRQPFGYAALRYESAGRAGSEESGSGVLFPMLPRREVRALLEDAAPEFAVEVDRPRLQRLPHRALPRYIVGDVIATAVIIAIVMGTIRAWRDGLPWWGYLPLLGLPFEIVFGWLGWRDGGWALDDRVLLLRTRGVARSTFITPRRRIQHRRVTTNPLQRRADLTTLHLAVASGGLGGHVSLAHLDAGTGERLLLALKPGMRPEL